LFFLPMKTRLITGSMVPGAAVLAALAIYALLGLAPSDLAAPFAVAGGVTAQGWAIKRAALVAAKALSLAIGLWGTGGLLLPWLDRGGCRTPAGTRLALGLAALAAVMLASGMLGLALRALGVAVFALLAVPAVVQAGRDETRITVWLAAAMASARKFPGWGRVLPMAAVGLTLAILALFVLATLSVPDNFWDSLVQHLPFPRRGLAEGVLPGPPPFFFGFPAMVQSVSLALIPVGGEYLVRVLNLVMLIACGLALRDTGASLGVPAGGRLAALAFVTTPICLVAGTHAGTDVAVAWYALLAVAVLVRDRPRWPEGHTGGTAAAMAGLFAGLATAAKYQGAAIVILGLGLVALGASRVGGRGRAMAACLLLGGWLAGYAPYGAHNWLARGNPVFPFANRVFGAAGFGEETAGAYQDELAGLAERETGREPGGVLPAGYFARFRLGLFGPLVAVGLVAVVAARARATVVPLACAAAYLSFWALAGPTLRWSLPGWGLFLLAAFAGMPGKPPFLPRLMLGAHLISACIWFPQAVALFDGPAPYLAGVENAVGYYTRMQFNSPVHARAFFELMENTGPGRRVLCVGEPRGYLCGDWAVAPAKFEPSPLALIARESRSPEEMAKRLRQEGFRFILINEAELLKMKLGEGLGDEPFPFPLMKSFFRERLHLAYARNWLSVYELAGKGQANAMMPEGMRLRAGPGTAALAALCDMVQADVMANRPADALKAAWLVVGDNPDSGMAWTALGNALVATGRGKEAVGAYDKAAVYGARYAGLFMNMGRAFAGDKLYGRAQLAFQMAAELDPISPDVDKAMDELMEQAGLGGLAYRRRRR